MPGRLEILAEVTRTVTRTLEVEAALPAALRALTQVSGEEIASLHLLDADRAALRLAAEYGMSPGLRAVNRALPHGQGLIGRVAATGRALAVGEVAAAPDLLPSARPVVERDGIRGFLCVPIASEGRVVGTLSLGRRTRRRFTEDDRSLLNAAADRIGMALLHARLVADTRKRLDDLVRAERQLARTDRLSAAGRLAAGATHEVRNLLAAIVGQGQLLLMDDQVSPAAATAIRRIVEETSRVAETLQRIVRFSRQSTPERRPCLLADQVDAVLSLVGSQLAAAGVEVETSIEECSPVWADESHLQQAILNLVLNAMEAMAPAPPRRLEIRVRPTEHGGAVDVLDTGPGIAAEDLPRIFDPFFTTKTGTAGAGLGLWIACSIAEGHGGRLTAANRPGGGAAFTLEVRNRRG